MSYSAIRKTRDGSYIPKTINETLRPSVRLDPIDGITEIHGSYATIYLSERPWQGPTGTEYSISIAGGFTLVEDADPSGALEFFCDWQTGILFFDSSVDWSAADLAISYTGIGGIVDWERMESELGGGSGSVTFDGVYQTPSGSVSGTTAQEWINLHFPSSPPAAQISGTPAFGFREIGDDITNPTITGSGTLGSNPDGTLTLLELFRGTVAGTAIGVQASPVPSVGYPSVDTFVVSSDQTYTAQITDSETRSNTTTGAYRFVYPFFATSVGNTTLTSQALVPHSSSYFSTSMVAEGDLPTEKQKADFSSGHSVITGVEFYNTVSGNWEWLGGTQANSLTLWDSSAENHTVQGNIVSYTRYTYNGAKVGARLLRWYT